MSSDVVERVMDASKTAEPAFAAALTGCGNGMAGHWIGGIRASCQGQCHFPDPVFPAGRRSGSVGVAVQGPAPLGNWELPALGSVCHGE